MAGLLYSLPDGVLAFSTGKDAVGGMPEQDARITGLRASCQVWQEGGQVTALDIPSQQLMIPRQTHSVHVAWVDKAGEVADTDAVLTTRRGLCVAVKTADCIPILLYDRSQQVVAAVHAGWRGTVGRILTHTLAQMQGRSEDVWAVIAPGISQEAFEVGDEVYDRFAQASFPMERIARRYPSTVEGESSRWHLDLWEANRWLLEEAGVRHIRVVGVCTYQHHDRWYSARRESIHTGRNINGIMLPL